MCCCIGSRTDSMDPEELYQQAMLCKDKGEDETFLSGTAKKMDHHLIADAKSHRTALRLFKKAMDLGHIASQYELGKMCINLGIRIDAMGKASARSTQCRLLAPRNISVIEVSSWYKEIPYEERKELDFSVNNALDREFDLYNPVRNDFARIGLIYLQMAVKSGYEPAQEALAFCKRNYAENGKASQEAADRANDLFFKQERERNERARQRREWEAANPELVEQERKLKELEANQKRLETELTWASTELTRLKYNPPH